MAINYEWSYPNFECDSSNIVQTIHWRLTATETVGEDTFTASVYGSCNGSEGMNFDTMTQDHCKNCVLENLEKTEAEMQSSLSEQIEAQKTPTLTSKVKEW